METELQKIQDRLSPSAAFVKQLKKRLRKEYWSQRKKKIFAWEGFSIRKYATVTALVLVLGGSISAYAYESPDVTNGSPLYGLKLTLENLESSFATSTQAQAEFHFKLALRRLQESKVLAAKGTVDVQTMAAISDESHTALLKLDTIQDSQIRINVLTRFRKELASNLDEVSGKIKEGIVVNGNSNSTSGYRYYSQDPDTEKDTNLNVSGQQETSEITAATKNGEDGKMSLWQASIRSNSQLKTKLEGLLQEVNDQEEPRTEREEVDTEDKVEVRFNANSNQTVSTGPGKGRSRENRNGNRNPAGSGSIILDTEADTEANLNLQVNLNRNLNKNSNVSRDEDMDDAEDSGSSSESSTNKNSNGLTTNLNTNINLVPSLKINFP